MNYLVVGLGNIGYEYENTRHNIGFMVLDAWAHAQKSDTIFKSDRYGSITEIRFKGRKFILVKPSTYMNLSGKAVNYWLKKTNVPIENLLVLVDDMALPLGSLRLRKKGSDGGHNGLASISETLGTDTYPRLRMGIGSHMGFGSQVDFVLGKFTPEEIEEVTPMIEKSISLIKSFGTIGVDRTMNTFNVKPPKEVLP